MRSLPANLTDDEFNVVTVALAYSIKHPGTGTTTRGVLESALMKLLESARGQTTCRWCSRAIVSVDDEWIDPAAVGDDIVWRATCDSHDAFIADHEPV